LPLFARKAILREGGENRGGTKRDDVEIYP